MEVAGGQLIVHNGNYTARMGNGIFVKDGNVTINSGSFSGKDSYTNIDGNAMSGAGASYGFKMFGGEVTIEDGNFESTGGGAFISGTNANSATATIKKGTFTASGTAGLSVWMYTTVTIGNVGGAQEDITISGISNAISIEKQRGANSSATSITINCGEYSGQQDGIWYGDGTSRLTINDGYFHSDGGDARDARYGLNISENPNGNITISGGTFTTGSENNNAISGVRITYVSILSDGAQAVVTYRNGNTDTYGSEDRTYITDTDGFIRRYYVQSVVVS